MIRTFGESSNKYSIAFAWLPTKVKTHCTGIWHYKWVWLKHYRYQYIYYSASDVLYMDKYALKENKCKKTE